MPKEVPAAGNEGGIILELDHRGKEVAAPQLVVIGGCLPPNWWCSASEELIMEPFAGGKERGKAVHDVEDDAEEALDEIEGFDDFTIASTWERFISEIEAVCRLWIVDGRKNLLDKGAECLSSRRNLYRIKCELKHGVKLYGMEYNFHIHNNDKVELWDDDLQSLQLSFGVIEFLVIAPISASGVVLDAPEASKLLSAVAIALSNCGSNWPAFVPVHDPSRQACIGIQNMGTTFTRRFDSDRIGSQVPVRLMHLEGLYELFVSKFALAAVDFSMNCFNVCSTMRLTYRTPYADLDTESQDRINHESKGDTDEVNHIRTLWDDNCPWSEWYSAEDPVKGFELTAIWGTKTFEGSAGMAELENESPFDAERWLLLPIISQSMIDDSIGKFGFASQLKYLVCAFERSFDAKYVEDFVSAENSLSDITKTSDSTPPPTVVDRILKDLFHDGVERLSSMEFGSRNSRFIKGAPLGSLFAQFCLHLLWLGNCNIRAIATLWIEFVREVRWCWEESQPLPKMPTSSSIDLSACLVHQKLQMLSICIEKKNLLVHSGIEGEAVASGVNKVDLCDLSDHSYNMLPKECKGGSSSLRLVVRNGSEESLGSSGTHGHGTRSGVLQSTSAKRRGSQGVVESTMLLNSFQNMHAPSIQDAPPMTEDMHEERLRAAEAFGNLLSFSGQLERDVLSSDMSAFKAANPDAIFEDFIRWHSPSDWESDEDGDESTHGMVKSPIFSWPPKGRLSQRMAEHGSLWRNIWDTSPALAASEQRPLLDPICEGEKILHYLETLKPHQLLEQMVCTAFRASADTLSQTKFGDFRLMKVKIDQLYHTLASTLKSLANHFLEKDELIGDLKQLCVLFEHIEKLVVLAASIHLKLSDAPRLSEAIFQEYFNFYLPKLGTGSTSSLYDKDFNSKQVVKVHERDVIASFFPSPTASQSWRKVLSMGNLLFGHEPTLREIIFSVNDSVSHGQYSSSNIVSSMGDIETHRMYICGTSNDLCVALSVTSWD